MVSRRAVGRANLAGVQDANKRYEKWSMGGWLSDSGIEGHVVSTVGEKLHGVLAARESLQMEVPYRDIRELCEADPPRGRPRTNVNARNRADIVIFNAEWSPVCVIEVKRLWWKERCLSDLVSIRNLILRYGRQRNGSLNMGFLTFLLEGWEEDDVTAEQCLKRREREIRTVLREEFDPEGLNLECRRSAIRRWLKKYRELYEDEPNWVHAALSVGLWCR